MKEILHVEEKILQIEEEIEKEQHRPRTASIAVRFTGSTALNILELAVDQSSIGTIEPLEEDGVTVTPGTSISNAVFVAPPDPSFIAIDNIDATISITAKTVSAAGVTGEATATVTDQDGAVSRFSTPFTVMVV